MGVRRGHKISGWWKKILDMVEGREGAWFGEKIVLRVGDGKDTDFWESMWTRGTTLKARFPWLFHLSANKMASVSEMGRWSCGKWEWDNEWRRALREREEAGARELYTVLHNYSLTEGEADSWGGRGGIVEKERRRGQRRQEGRNNFSCIHIWQVYAPFKAQVMAWRLAWNRLPTMDNLRKRLVILVEEWKCYCCREEVETGRHLFFDCLEIQDLWQKMIRWSGIS